MDRKFDTACVSATTEPASRRMPRVASAEISDSPCKLIRMVEPALRKRRSVAASQLTPCGSRPVAGSSSRKNERSFSSAPPTPPPPPPPPPHHPPHTTPPPQ